MIITPPRLEDLRAGTQLYAGLSKSTIIADIDFETYSEAGFIWSEHGNKYLAPYGASKKGLPVVGMAVYAQHPSTDVISCAYDLKNGEGKKHWKPGDVPPFDLLNHVREKHLLEAWNIGFEFWIWNEVCTRLYEWPILSLDQVRCAQAKSRAFGLPNSLNDAGIALNIIKKKDKDGWRLIQKFSMPRNPTKTNPSRRITANDDPVDMQRFYDYNIRDIEAEAELSSLIPDLSQDELEFWQIDQRINHRGVAMDGTTIRAAINVIDQAKGKYNAELRNITGGAVKFATQVKRLRDWMESRGVMTTTLTKSDVSELLQKWLIPPDVRRVLQIRESIGSAAVSKLYAMANMMARGDRLHDLFVYHSAHTGRHAGRGVQPQNLPNSGLRIAQCDQCLRCFTPDTLPPYLCVWCFNPIPILRMKDWGTKATEDAIALIRLQNLDCLEHTFGDAIATISGCLRGMFISSPNHDLICSDYSAIEAVVLAELSGEEWQQDVFRTHGKIYEMTASKISGVPFEEFDLHKGTSGQHHPLRKLGKVASLASGYGSWIHGWEAFGAREFLTEDEIKKSILAWRKANPMIVEMWGGQERFHMPEYFGLEGAVVKAILTPGIHYSHRSISYIVKNNVLYCKLPSGRCITYHKPKLRDSERRAGTYAISYEKWNNNPKYGGLGWMRVDTYGGKLTENVCQAVARDILAAAIVRLEKSGYPVVLHVHDEIVSEVVEGFGSVEEFEGFMSIMPDWANGWPIKAKGGWRAKRYAK